jgi:hypothetical protein
MTDDQKAVQNYNAPEAGVENGVIPYQGPVIDPKDEVEILPLVEKDGKTYVDLPRSMAFSATPKGQVMARFNLAKDTREFPFNSPVVKNEMAAMLRKHLGRKPKKEELDEYLSRCVSRALREGREEILPGEGPEEDPVVKAAVFLMVARLKDRKKRFLHILSTLRDALVEIAKCNDIEHENWPKKHHFAGYIKARIPLFTKANLCLEFWERKNIQRPVSLTWIDPNKIPDCDVKVTQGDARRAMFVSPLGEEQEVDLLADWDEMMKQKTLTELKEEANRGEQLRLAHKEVKTKNETSESKLTLATAKKAEEGPQSGEQE